MHLLKLLVDVIALLPYLKLVGGFPDHGMLLSTCIPSLVIAGVNKEVDKATVSVMGGKCGHIQKYSLLYVLKLPSFPISMRQLQQSMKVIQ